MWHSCVHSSHIESVLALILPPILSTASLFYEMKNEKKVLIVGLGFVVVCLVFLHSNTRSLHGGVIYNAILPSSGWTNVFAQGTKTQKDPAGTVLEQHSDESNVLVFKTESDDHEQEFEQRGDQSDVLVLSKGLDSGDPEHELKQHKDESNMMVFTTESVDTKQDGESKVLVSTESVDPEQDDDYELSGQLFQTDTYAVSELLTNAKDDDETNDPVTIPSESATLSTTEVYTNASNESNKLHTIVLYLAGQQASGVHALINVQCLVHSLDLPVVFLEPVIVLNKFKAMPLVQFDLSGNPMTRESLSNMVVHFSDLFDLDVFNKFSTNMDYAQVAPRDAFFADAPRKIIFVHLYQGWESATPKLAQLWPQQDSPAGDCFDPVKSSLESDPRYQLRLLVHKGFCVVKAVTYRVEGAGQGFIFSEAELKESILGDLPYSDFTLVFSLWMPKFVLPGPKGIHCVNSGYHSAKGQFQPSQRLLDNANYYKEHFLNSTKDHLTLMIRLEHIYTFLSRPRKNWNVKKCLDSAIAKVKEFQTERKFGKPFVTLDVGKYGSKSLRRYIGRDNMRRDMQYINELLSSVYDGQWSMREWENSFIEATGGIDESSYIAALQRTLASRAECLVLVGGGMFQELTMRKYMETHDKKDRCIHLLCLKNDVNSEIAKS